MSTLANNTGLFVKQIMRYLIVMLSLGLLWKKDGSNECVGYPDFDRAGDTDDCKSTSGYMFQTSGAVISWRVKKQTGVALSTAENEYMALASAAQEAFWMRQLLTDLKYPPREPTKLIFEDNQSAICLAKNPQFHGRAKCAGVKYHFIREQVGKATVELQDCSTEEMVANMLTKGLRRNRFIKPRLILDECHIVDR